MSKVHGSSAGLSMSSWEKVKRYVFGARMSVVITFFVVGIISSLVTGYIILALVFI